MRKLYKMILIVLFVVVIISSSGISVATPYSISMADGTSGHPTMGTEPHYPALWSGLWSSGARDNPPAWFRPGRDCGMEKEDGTKRGLRMTIQDERAQYAGHWVIRSSEEFGHFLLEGEIPPPHLASSDSFSIS